MESFHTILQFNFYLIIQHFFFSLKPNQTCCHKNYWTLIKVVTDQYTADNFKILYPSLMKYLQ